MVSRVILIFLYKYTILAVNYVHNCSLFVCTSIHNICNYHWPHLYKQKLVVCSFPLVKTETRFRSWKCNCWLFFSLNLQDFAWDDTAGQKSWLYVLNTCSCEQTAELEDEKQTPFVTAHFLSQLDFLSHASVDFRLNLNYACMQIPFPLLM